MLEKLENCKHKMIAVTKGICKCKICGNIINKNEEAVLFSPFFSEERGKFIYDYAHKECVPDNIIKKIKNKRAKICSKCNKRQLASMKIKYDSPSNKNLKITAWVCKWHYAQILDTHNNVEILEKNGPEVPERILTHYLREYIIGGAGNTQKQIASQQEILENEEYKEIGFRFFCRESRAYQLRNVIERYLHKYAMKGIVCFSPDESLDVDMGFENCNNSYYDEEEE